MHFLSSTFVVDVSEYEMAADEIVEFESSLAEVCTHSGFTHVPCYVFISTLRHLV